MRRAAVVSAGCFQFLRCRAWRSRCTRGSALRYYAENPRSTHLVQGHFGTLLWRFATVLFVIAPAIAQPPPGVLYTTTVPNSTPQFPAKVTAIAADASGNTYVTGTVSSNGLTSTPGVLQPSFGGGDSDAFVAKFDSTGTLVFLTYLGGSGYDAGTSIVVDAAGHIYVGGTTTSSNFQLAGTPYRPPLGSPPALASLTFVAEISGDGKTLIWSTILNQSQPRLAVGPDSSVYDLAATQFTPQSSFTFPQARALTKLTSTGQFVALLDVPAGTTALGVGPDGSVYIGGFASANDIVATPGAWQTTFAGSSEGFIAKANPTLSGYTWATYTGTGSAALELIPAPDGQSLWIAGSTTASTSFTSTPGALQSQTSPYDNGGFLVRLSADGSHALSASYLPIPPTSMALDPSSNLIISAFWGGAFFATPGAPWPCYQTTGNDYIASSFIGRIDAAAQHVLWGTGTPNQFPYVTSDNQGNAVAAGYSDAGGIVLMALDTSSILPHLLASCVAPSDGGGPGPLAPGELFSIYGADYGPAQGVVAQPSGGSIGTSLGGIQVTVEGTPVPLLYVSAAQINAVAPFLLDGRTAAHVQIVTFPGTSNEAVLGVREVVPELFAISNQDGALNSQTNPAHAGDYLTIWTLGMGQTNPPGIDGAIAAAAGGTPLLPITLQLSTVQNPNISFGVPPPPVSVAALYAGNAPGLVSGVTQINFEMPALPPPLLTATPVPGPPYAAYLTITSGGASVTGYLLFE